MAPGGMARQVHGDLAATLLGSHAGQELVKIGLQDDVPFCAERDTLAVVPQLGIDGVLRAA